MQVTTWDLVVRAASLVAVMSLATAAGATIPSYTGAVRQWTVDPGGSMVGAPAPITVGGVTRGLLVTLGDGRILTVSPDGHVTGSMKMDFQTGYPAVAGIVDRSGQPRILAVDDRASVYGFTLAGKRLWKVVRDERPAGFSVTVLGDLYGDGLNEAIVSDGRGHLIVVDGKGRVRLDVKAGRYRVCPAAVGDIDGDGKAEVIFGTDEGDMFCMDGYGRVRWARRFDGRFGRSLPLIADPNRDDHYQVYITKSFVGPRAGMLALDARTGKLLYKVSAIAQSYQSTAAADLYGNGKLEVLFGDKTSRLYCQDGHGKRKWIALLDLHGIGFAPAIANLPGAGGVRIFATGNAASSTSPTLFVLDRTGKIIGALDTQVAGGSPLICRLAGSNRLSLLVTVPGNKLACYALPETTAPAKILWPGPGSDAERTNFLKSPVAQRIAALAPPATKPVGTRSGRMGTNYFRLAVMPGADRVAVEAEGAGGTARTRITLIADGARFCDLPFVADHAGTYRVVVRWLNADGVVVGTRDYLWKVDGSSPADVADTQRLVLDLVRPGNKAPYFGLRAALAASAPGLLSRAKLVGTPEAYDQARWTRDYWSTLARVIEGPGPVANVQVRPVHNPWVDFDARKFMAALTNRTPVNRLRVTMLDNAYSSAAIAITNLQTHPVTLRIEPGDFALQGGSTSVPAERVVQVRSCPLIRSSATGKKQEDPLPLLGQAQTVHIGLGETRKVWLTFRSRDIDPGTYTSTFRFGDPAYQTATQDVPVTLKVLPVRLPDKRTFYHNNWVYLANYSDEKLRNKVIDDEIEHGCNVFNIPSDSVQVDPQGNIVGSTAAYDDLMKQLYARGAFFMIDGSVNVNWPAGANPDQATKDAVWAKALRWYGEHMTSIGVPYDDYALYLMDEPGLHGDDPQFRGWADDVRRCKAADPRIQIYANPAGAVTPAMLKPLENLVDVWMPDLHLVKTDPEGLGAIFKHAKHYWHYEAPGDQRSISPLGWYRIQPWVSYRYGMDGDGFWVYGDTHYWLSDPATFSEYGAVYLQPQGPVSTRRWEAAREGMQDYELLVMLRDEAEKAGDAGKSALTLIDDAVAFVTKGQSHVSDISRQTDPICPDFDRWMRYREQIIQAIIKLAPPKQ